MSSPDQPPSPNVIWFVTDQMRAQATGYAGDPNLSTPHLDRLAAEGTNLTNAISGTPLCCPFRGSLLTGRYPHRSGVPGHQSPLPVDAPTIAHTFQATGYRTCYVGKWHLDGDRPELAGADSASVDERVRMIPPKRRGGFQDWWAYENNNRPFDCLVHTDHDNVPAGTTIRAATDEMASYRLPGYEVDALTDILLDWLRQHTQQHPHQPFFAVLSVQPPHNPYTAPANAMARHTPADVQLRANVPPIPRVQERSCRDLAGYYAAIEQIDHNLGRIREALESGNLADDTYVMFFSDHGDMHGSHGQWRKTAPWEESIRIPFLIGGPSREHQNARRLDIPLNHVDIAPTTLGTCGIDVPTTMAGTDYSRCILSSPANRTWPSGPDSAYLSIPVPTGHGESVGRPWRGLVTQDRWKYVCLEGQPWLMFNLDEDPYELANLAHDPAYRPQRADLHDRLMSWITQTEDSFQPGQP